MFAMLSPSIIPVTVHGLSCEVRTDSLVSAGTFIEFSRFVSNFNMGSLKLIPYSKLCIRLRYMLLVIFDALNHFFIPDSFEDIAIQRNAPVLCF